ncbi:MAG: GatB/YqeY domain-containing protein [Patescibacteria group bacterium]|jgi:hypothetical protein
MSNLSARLEEDFTIALKSKDAIKVGALRLLKAALKNEQIQKKAELLDEDIVKVLRRELKARQDSITSYLAANRQDLVAQEQLEADLISAYLPAEMPEEELSKIIDKILSENSFTAKDFGQVMKLVMAQTKGNASGNAISALVKKALK